jgi:hypothetical protein
MVECLLWVQMWAFMPTILLYSQIESRCVTICCLNFNYIVLQGLFFMGLLLSLYLLFCRSLTSLFICLALLLLLKCIFLDQFVSDDGLTSYHYWPRSRFAHDNHQPLGQQHFCRSWLMQVLIYTQSHKQCRLEAHLNGRSKYRTPALM